MYNFLEYCYYRIVLSEIKCFKNKISQKWFSKFVHRLHLGRMSLVLQVDGAIYCNTH